METVRLEPFARAHLGDVAILLADPEVLRFTRVPDPPAPDFAEQWLARYEAGRREGTCEGFAAVLAGGGFLGLALAPEIDRAARELELGYIVTPGGARPRRGDRDASPAHTLAFDEAQALRIRLIINVGNPASERAAERCGYVREGVMRSLHVKQEQRIDAGLWSRLPSDPEP